MTERLVSFESAKAQYIHRYTLEHIPQWAKRQSDNGRYYAPQWRSDQQWYDNTAFPGESGISRRADYCQTGAPTWPLGQWLKKPLDLSDTFQAHRAMSSDDDLTALREAYEWKECVDPACPSCGATEGIYGRADLRWQPATQSWEIGDMEDSIECTSCDHAWSMSESKFPGCSE